MAPIYEFLGNTLQSVISFLLWTGTNSSGFRQSSSIVSPHSRFIFSFICNHFLHFLKSCYIHFLHLLITFPPNILKIVNLPQSLNLMGVMTHWSLCFEVYWNLFNNLIWLVVLWSAVMFLPHYSFPISLLCLGLLFCLLRPLGYLFHLGCYLLLLPTLLEWS